MRQFFREHAVFAGNAVLVGSLVALSSALQSPTPGSQSAPSIMASTNTQVELSHPQPDVVEQPQTTRIAPASPAQPTSQPSIRRVHRSEESEDDD